MDYCDRFESIFRCKYDEKTRVKAKEAAGQKIECMDGDFEVHQSILINSDILWDFFEGKIQDFHLSIYMS